MLRLMPFLILLATSQAVAAPCAGFNDMDDANPFCPSVEWMKNRGITLGCSANAYCPDDNVSRLQIAAFLMRLGNALVPPNVLVVAQSGGAFRSIQAAIDYAATMASPTRPFVIRVAPGTYAESITLAPDVEVEGTSMTATLLKPHLGTLGCAPSGPAAVVMAPDSRLRHIGIEGCNNGIYIDGGPVPGISFHGMKIQDVQISNSATGIRTAGIATQLGTIERVRMNLQGAAENIGFYVTGSLFTLADVSIFVAGSTNTVGIKVTGGAQGRIDRAEIVAVGPSGPNIFGVEATDYSTVAIRDSSIHGIWGALRTTGTATVTAANTSLIGPIVGSGATCYNTFHPTALLPVTC